MPKKKKVKKAKKSKSIPNSYKIEKDNNDKNRQFQTDTLKSAYRHGRAMQKFEDQQSLKEFRKSRKEAYEQIDFNEIAQRQALTAPG